MSETKKDALAVAFGLRLRAERHRMQLSLSVLSARTDNALSKSRISNYEQGIRRLGLEEAVILARALGDVSPPIFRVSTTEIRCRAPSTSCWPASERPRSTGKRSSSHRPKPQPPRQDQCAQAA
jgi:transcriptional regulator with XRE-family HTH domain